MEALLGQGLVDGGLGACVVLVLGGHLGGNKQLVASHAAGADALADAGLVAIGLRGVDHAVANGHGVLHRRGGSRVVHEPRAQAQARDLGAVSQRVVLVQDAHDILLCISKLQ